MTLQDQELSNKSKSCALRPNSQQIHDDGGVGGSLFLLLHPNCKAGCLHTSSFFSVCVSKDWRLCLPFQRVAMLLMRCSDAAACLQSLFWCCCWPLCKPVL